MEPPVATERLALIAGLGTWAVIGVPAALALVGDPARLAQPRWIAWLVAYLAFGAIFAAAASGRLDGLGWRAHRALLGVQTLLAAVALAALPDYGVTAILLIITASHAAHVYPLRPALGWVGLQTLVLAWHGLASFASLEASVVQTLAYLGFQVFALLTTHNALSEARARRALARSNAELEATQRLLAEASRAQERMRISRELHDLLGHHLTALILNLDVASRTASGPGAAPVAKAHALAKLLMADVREAVSRMREDDAVDLAAALAALVADVPQPAIHLDVSPDLRVTDVQHAQVIVRCVQEAITNAIRHAGAQNLWIAVERDGEEIAVRARDDGRGAREAVPGNGLTGMRERVEAAGGRLQVRTHPGAGFALDARLPAGA